MADQQKLNRKMLLSGIFVSREIVRKQLFLRAQNCEDLADEIVRYNMHD